MPPCLSALSISGAIDCDVFGGQAAIKMLCNVFMWCIIKTVIFLQGRVKVPTGGKVREP